MKIKQVVVAASTYGSLPRVNAFIQSVYNSSEPNIPYGMLVVDDGTPDQNAVLQRVDYCRKLNVVFSRNSENLGIPGTWNRIFSIAQQEMGADLVVCFNDDIRLLAPGWLSRLIFFFEQNENVGGVGLPLVNEGGFRDNDTRWNAGAGRVGAAIGCAFAMQPDTLFRVVNPDQSRGFWTGLRAFHEEVHAGFKLAQLGYDSFMMPWPPCHHIGGATFRSNEELIWMQFPDGYDMGEFLRYAQGLPWYVSEYEEKYNQGIVDRMMCSRFMFAKEWGLLGGERMRTLSDGQEVDAWAEPQRIVHDMVVTPKPQREIVWLDRAGQVKKGVL